MASSLQEAKITLARAAAVFGTGGDWGRLIDALRAYDTEIQKFFVQSPIDQLQQIQGRAQASAQLLEIFENCRQIAETAKQKEIKKP